jgi:chemotaxis protein MotB
VPRRLKPPDHENHERWMVSYADFVTLLFALFVVLFASGQADHQTASHVAESVKEALKDGSVASVVREILAKSGAIETPPRSPRAARPAPEDPLPPVEEAPERPDSGFVQDLRPTKEYLESELRPEIERNELSIRLEGRGLIVSLRQARFFPSGAEKIDPGTYPILDKVARALRNLSNPIRLEGHTDAIPIRNERFRSNWELSAARGIEVLELLSTRYGIPVGQLAVAGFADTQPVASNDSEEGRTKNRRVDIVVMSQEAMLAELPERQTQAKPSPLGPVTN